MKLQKRHIMWSLKELYQLFLTQHPEIKIPLSKFCSLRPVNVLLSSAMPRDAGLGQYHENIRMLYERIAKEIQALPPYFEALGDNFVCDNTSEFCTTGKCAKCPSEWLLEISADAPPHKTINWCQWERVTQTMPGKREKGQRQVTKMLKVLKESSTEEAITSLMKKMPHYLQHVFVQRKQTRFFQEKFKTLMRKRQLFRLILQRITLAFNRMKFKQPAGVKNK